MKKTRFLAGLLCIMMVLTMVPMITNATISDSLYDQIGGLMGRISSRAVNDATWLSMNFDFTNNFSQTDYIKTTDAINNPVEFTAGGFAYDNNNGLTSAKGDYMVWRYFPAGLESQGWSPLVFGAYYLRFKLEEGGILEPQACAYYNHARSFVQLSNTGVTVWSNKNNDGCGADGNDRGTVANANNYVPGTDWNQMVVVANGGSANSANGYSVYMKKDSDAEFTLVASTNGYRGGGAWKSTGFGLGGSGYAVSDAVMLEGSDVKLEEEQNIPNPGITSNLTKAIGKILGGTNAIPATASADWPTTNLMFNESFDATQDGITTPEGVTYNENGINFPASNVTWRYRPTCTYNGWSPLCISGNYTFGFRLRENGILQNQVSRVWKNDQRTYMDFSTTGVTVYNGGDTDGAGLAVTTNLVDYVPGTDWNDVMVVADPNGGYDVYMKKASDKKFTHVASAPTYRKGGTWAKTGLEFTGNNAYINYATSYISITEPEMVITDKNGIDVTTVQEDQLDITSLTATILPNSDDARVLFFAIYGEDGNLVDITRHNIPAEETKSTFTCNPFEKANKIRKIKAFLWNDTENIAPVTNMIEVKGNAYSLEDDWTFGGKALADGNTLVLDSVSGVESFAEYETNIGSQFDITWDMNIEQFSGEENAQIYTGTNRILLDIDADGITYNTESGTTKLSWIVGNGNHNYRVIGNGNSALLYMDGFFVGNLSGLESSTDTSKIRFWNKDASKMEISDISFGSYSASNIPTQGFFDEFDNGDTCGWSTNPTSFTVSENTFTKQWVNSKNGNLVVEDYHLAQSPNTCVTSSSKTITEVGDEFVIQMKIRFSSWGTESYMITEIGGKRLTLDFREKFFSVGVDKGYSTEISDEFLLGTTDYHDLTIETYNRMNNARIYLNGVLVQDTPLATSTSGLNRVFFQANGGWYLPATMEIEYFKYSPKYYNVSVTSPTQNEVFYVGDQVTLSASKHSQFVLNGLTVADGTSVTLDNLSAGRYQLTAKSGSDTSEIIQFVVKEKATASLQVSQSGNVITASLASISGFDSVANVSYLLDGNKVGETNAEPYQVSVSNISAENHMLEAVAYDKNGIVVARFSKEIPAVINSNVTTAYANEISYTVSASGGTVEIKNGNHRFYMIHKSNGITYTTASGKKVYTKGTGNFKVLTDGPFAEVYRNGQYIFGFIMPKTTEVGSSFGNGITDAGVVVPIERQSYFTARNLNVQNTVYQLAELPHNHNLDFVASPEDEVHLTLNDGYYRNDITIKDGDIYVWEAARNNSVAEQKYVTTMASGDVYYRIETSAGMSRLYADGKWIYTFRNGQVAGQTGTLAVNVTAGDGLSYLGVNSNQDLYYYTDTFDQSGEFSSTDYWMTSNGLTATQDEEDLLLTSTAQNGIAELSSSVGNASLTAHLTIISGTEGFWFVANHGVSDAYTKIGYNFTTGKYEIIDVKSGNVVNSKTASGSLATGKRVLMNLKIEETATGKALSLYVDGSKVISSDSYFANRGRVGFMVANGKASLGYIVYRGDAKPVLDVRDNPLNGMTTLDMIETPTKTYLVNGGGGFVTSDGGRTWDSFTPSKGAGLEATYGFGGMSENMVKLSNGEILAAVRLCPSSWWDEYGQRQYIWNIYCSEDNGMNWRKLSAAQFPGTGNGEDAAPDRCATVNRMTQGPSGRVYLVSAGGNSEDYGNAEVWMSDDNGRNWFKSMTPIDALQTGYVIAEAVVIETTQNTRFYFRTDKGQLCYYESYDYGETWDMIPHTTPFISSMTCFGMEADPADPDTLYVGWGYDNINLYARAQFPRTRWAVAKSTDAGNTWEMLGTVHENNSIEHNMMNLNLNVAEDYIYLNAFSSDTLGTTLPWTSRIVSFPKNLQRTTPRLEQLHTMYPTQIENTIVLPKEQEYLTMAVHPGSGMVSLRGQLIQGGASGEYVSLDLVAAFIGATLETSDSGNAVLKLGDGSVEIPSGSVKKINGKLFGKLSLVADKLNMTVVDEDGTKLMSRKSDWSARQKNALRYATDLFSLLP